MKLPNRTYRLTGMPLPDNLSSIGILGFVLQNGVQVTTVDNKLTTEQVRAIATFLVNHPDHPACFSRQKIQEWAREHFKLDEETVDPSGLITLTEV
jgi:hypothetical protein